MKLYKVSSAPVGERWHSSKTGIKDFEELELPKEGRAGMAGFLNQAEAEVGSQSGLVRSHALDDLEQAEMRAVAAAGGTTVPRYESPLSASSTIAGIDAGMCAQAIRQMDGANLGKVVVAAIERMAQLSCGIHAGEINDG